MEENIGYFNKFLSLLKYLVYLGIVLLFIFCIVELVYRGIRSQLVPEKWDNINAVTESRHVPKPYVMFTAKPGSHSFEGEINSLGYIGALPTDVKPKNEFRIFVIGASAVFQGKPPFVKLLENLFHESGLSQVKVFNFGIVSSVSRQELVRILIDIGAYQPDLIVSYSGYNDLYDTGWDPRINYPHRYILYQASPYTQLRLKKYKLLSSLALSSQLLRDWFGDKIFGNLTEDILPSNLPSRTSVRPLIASAYFQNLRLSKAISAVFGAEFVSFFQPTVFSKKLPSETEKTFMSPYELAIADSVRSAVTSEAKKYGKELQFTDLSDFFSEEKGEIFSDRCHYLTQYPQEMMAKYLFKVLLNKVKHPAKIKPALQNLITEDVFTDY